MATANAQNLGSTGQGDGGFFSRIFDWANTATQGIKSAQDLYNNVSPIWTGNPTQGVRTEPTFQGVPTPTNTGTDEKPQGARDYTPFILGGVGILALMMFVK